MSEGTNLPFWGIVDILGHVRYAGRISEETIAGFPLLRIDVPEADGEPARTVYQAPASLYAIHPCSEELARLVAVQCRPAALHAWELPDELRQKLREATETVPPLRGRPAPYYLDYGDMDPEDEPDETPFD